MLKLLKIILLNVIILPNIINCVPIEEHPRYTAARLTNTYKLIIEGSVIFADSKLFFEDVSVLDCQDSGNYEYLETKLNNLIPLVEHVQIKVKFAYPVPFTNHSIQFTIEETLEKKDGSTMETDYAMFARFDESVQDFKIFEIRELNCQ